MAVTYAKLTSGDPLMVDYTPSGDVTGGDVVVVGGDIRIAHRDIAANEPGSLAAGGGVYTMPKASGDGGIGAGVIVYWNTSTHVITSTKGSNKIFGRTIAASGDTDTSLDVIHDPWAGYAGS